jgi:hypothetical protein
VDAQLLTRIHKVGVSNTESMDLVVWFHSNITLMQSTLCPGTWCMEG